MKNTTIVLVLVICLLNLLRMAVYMLGSDAYTLKQTRRIKRRGRWHLPSVTVVIPAHNEEKVIIRALQSLYEANYPARKLEVIVADDGSTDRTRSVALAFKRSHNDRCNFRVITRPNKGKASALNYVMQRHAKGSIVVCLDADSYFMPSALRNAVQLFRDRQVVALSSNVNIIEDGTFLALLQRFEYVVCYQMKKGQALMGVEYIVGGIGSMFRRSTLQKVGYYDTNTMTEDIDLTMKIIAQKTKHQKIAYAADSIVYTEAAHTLPALMRQRYRWKYGRSQTFLKHRDLFFSNTGRYAKRLAWFMLPFSIVQDVLFFFEPFMLGYFIYISARYANVAVFASALIVLTIYMLSNVWSSDHVSFRQKLRLSFYAPPMYLAMYVVAYAEYYALIKALLLAHRLPNSIKQTDFTWKSPERRNTPVA